MIILEEKEKCKYCLGTSSCKCIEEINNYEQPQKDIHPFMYVSKEFARGLEPGIVLRQGNSYIVVFKLEEHTNCVKLIYLNPSPINTIY